MIWWGLIMKTVQMTLGEDLITEVDKVAKKLRTTRSEFTRRALHDAISRLKEQEMEKKHREGYRRKPAKRGEFSDWETEQVWGDS
jgi:predicted transcriptional regulator